MIAHFDDMPPVEPVAARYFRSTLSDMIFKFVGETAFARSPSAGWFPTQVTLDGMKAATVEITAAEGEPS